MPKTKIKPVTLQEKQELLRPLIKGLNQCNMFNKRDKEVLAAILKDINDLKDIRNYFNSIKP